MHGGASQKVAKAITAAANSRATIGRGAYNDWGAYVPGGSSQKVAKAIAAAATHPHREHLRQRCAAPRALLIRVVLRPRHTIDLPTEHQGTTAAHAGAASHTEESAGQERIPSLLPGSRSTGLSGVYQGSTPLSFGVRGRQAGRFNSLDSCGFARPGATPRDA